MPGSKQGRDSKKRRGGQPDSHRRGTAEKAARGREEGGAQGRPSVPVMVALASVLGMLLAVLAIGLNLASVATYGKVSNVSTASDPIKSDPHSKGNPNAPVVVTEWSDFQCPACRAYYFRVEPDFDKQYVDTGKVRFVSNYFAFLGPESYIAAEAAEAAAEQGKFWAYSDLLWQGQGPENSGTFTATKLKEFASQVGLNRTAFDAALDSGKYRTKVLDQRREAEALGVNATPTFFVNGQKVQGVPPNIDAWAKIIDDAMGKKQ